MSEVMTVGVDVGSSHVSVACGDRVVSCPNVAGRPSDFVARKLFGEGWTVGERALEGYPALELCYPVRNGSIDRANRDAALEALGAVITELLGRIGVEEGAMAVVGVSPLALRSQRELFLNLFEGLFERVMLAPSTFLAGYAEGNINRVVVMDLGAGTVDITPLHGAIPSPEDHVVLRTGGDYLDHKIYELFSDAYPDLPCSTTMARQWKERMASFQDDTVEVDVLTLEGVKRVRIGHILRKACESLIPVVKKGLSDVLEQLPPERWNVYLGNVLLTGRTALIKGFPGRLIDALTFPGNVGVKLASRPDSAVAIGAAMFAEEVF